MMLSRRMRSRATIVTAQMMIISQFRIWHLIHTTVRPVALAKLHHGHRKPTRHFEPYLSG